MQVILALDLGTQTGWAVRNSDGSILLEQLVLSRKGLKVGECHTYDSSIGLLK